LGQAAGTASGGASDVASFSKPNAIADQVQRADFTGTSGSRRSVSQDL